MKSRKLTTGKVENIALKDKDIQTDGVHFSLKVNVDESYYVLKLHKNKYSNLISGLNAKEIVLNFNDDETVLESITISVDKEYLISKQRNEVKI
ncbi:MAG TPA: hypothetical protein VIK86_04735 [Candidatus Paceibacterota bacterium]